MESKALRFIKGFYNVFPTVGAVLANLAVCAMAILVTVTAILRYGFNWTPGWADSVCAFLVAFAVFMGAGYSLMKGEHIRITFVFKKLSLRVQQAVELVCGLLALLYVGYLTYSASELAMMSYRLNSRTPTKPLGWVAMIPTRLSKRRSAPLAASFIPTSPKTHPKPKTHSMS